MARPGVRRRARPPRGRRGIRLDELRFTAIEDRAQLLLDADRANEIIGDLSSSVRTHPLRERLHYLLMVAHYRCGRRADALKQFHSVRRLLIKELGIEPGEDLRKRHDQILNGTLRSPMPVPDSPATLSSPGIALPAVFAPPPPSCPAASRGSPGGAGSWNGWRGSSRRPASWTRPGSS